MVEAAIAPVLIGGIIAGLILTYMPTEPWIYDPDEVQLIGDIPSSLKTKNAETKETSKNGIPKATSMKDID